MKDGLRNIVELMKQQGMYNGLYSTTRVCEFIELNYFNGDFGESDRKALIEDLECVFGEFVKSKPRAIVEDIAEETMCPPVLPLPSKREIKIIMKEENEKALVLAGIADLKLLKFAHGCSKKYYKYHVEFSKQCLYNACLDRELLLTVLGDLYHEAVSPQAILMLYKLAPELLHTYVDDEESYSVLKHHHHDDGFFDIINSNNIDISDFIHNIVSTCLGQPI